MAQAPNFERPARAERERGGGGSALTLAAGVFAVVIGVLLRSAVNGQDRTDWNGSVETFLEILPLVLIVGGAIVLIVGGAAMLRRPRGADASRRRPRTRS